MERGRAGFNLGEVILAVGLIAIVLLALVGLTTSAIRSNEKAALLGPATQVSDSLMNRVIYEVDYDLPVGTRASFWGYSGAAPWLGPTSETIGGVEYEYCVYANDVNLGGAPGNGVKKVDVVVWWWDSKATSSTRQGYGRLQVQASRLVNE